MTFHGAWQGEKAFPKKYGAGCSELRLPCVGGAVMGQKPMTEGVNAIDVVKAVVR